MEKEPIILIDAFAQIYRGFFAIRSLSNSKGMPTNAVFALSKFLLRIHRDYPSNLGVFTFDVGKPAFRLEIAPDYKANRSPMPEELKEQLPYIEKIIKAFGWPVISKENYESDDIIAALATFHSGHPVYIITSDKDIAQLVDDRVKMLIPDRKSGGLSVFGSKEVYEKYSIPPERIVDFLSLTGDASDNIPGVRGVGPKTAATLINDFGSIESIIKSSGKIANPGLRDKIESASAILRNNARLVSLKTEIPVREWKDIRTLKRSQPDWRLLENICEELELRSISKEINALIDSDYSEQPSAENKFTPDLFG